MAPGGGCQFGLDPHHIIKRSQGGHDTKENVITLCRKHHDMAEENLISPEDLSDILESLYGYSNVGAVLGNQDLSGKNGLVDMEKTP